MANDYQWITVYPGGITAEPAPLLDALGKPALSRPVPPGELPFGGVSIGGVFYETQEAFDAFLVAENAKARKHNATCSRCHGPAYHGFGYAPTCERAGGCLADREPTEEDVFETFIGIEGGWSTRFDLDITPGSQEDTVRDYATRDLAVTAWREALLARAKAGGR